MSKEFYIGLAIAFVGIALAVLQMMYPIMPYVIGWPLVGVCAVATFICLDIGIRKKEYGNIIGSKVTHGLEGNITHAVTVAQKGSVETVSDADKRFIVSLCRDMVLQHGHIDPNGLLADRASGIPLNELMSRKCSQCETARNIRSDK
jgi:hypothetical protein